MRRGDNSPVDYTCPLIDEVISFIEDLDGECVSGYSVRSMVNVLEKIRKANTELREWGNDMYQELEDSKSDYEDQLAKLENDLEIVMDELKDVRDDLHQTVRERDELKENNANVFA